MTSSFVNIVKLNKTGYSLFHCGKSRLFSSTNVSSSKKDSEIPKNKLEAYFTSHKQETYGAVYDKKPFKMLLKANKEYKWCCCGWSKHQPFCDGTHKSPYLKIKLKPVKFMVDEEKEYYLCNCKHTNHRPFCDGAHKKEEIQQQTPIKP